jgi:peroxiredoxin
LQLAAVRGASGRYEAGGIEVFGINGASSRSHKGFARRHGFTARLLSDRGLHVARSYDAVGRFGPIAYVKRTVVGIDRSGRVTYYERGMPSTDHILAGLAAHEPEPPPR